MASKQQDLARRLVAHPKWRWIPGMQVSDPETRIVTVARGRGNLLGDLREEVDPLSPVDLSDFATAAILLRWVLELDEEEGGLSIGRRLISAGWTDDLGTVAATALLEAWSG